MRRLALFGWLIVGNFQLSAQETPTPPPPKVVWSNVTNSAGFLTNGAAVFRASYTDLFDIRANPQYLRNQKLLQSTNKLPAAFRERLLKANEPEILTNVMHVTNMTFEVYDSRSLQYHTWTNLLSRTNGRTMQVWARRVHPAGWPKSAKVSAEWNHASLVWGLKGFTGISPCWEGEGESGQAPVTALTRRHGYTRGHGIGAPGAGKKLAGKKVWFLDPDDKVVQVRVEREIVRAAPGRDYTILLFDEDLPAKIQPLRVASTNLLSRTYTMAPQAPTAILFMEQHGNSATLLPGMTYPVNKGGDSGSANLLLLPDELVFVAGRSTSGADAGMQADMDELCRLEGLNPAKYQMSWFDDSKFPKYPLAETAAREQSSN